jgi:ATP-binding cassette subfamily B (MDR/TAP) protein 8
MVAIYIIEPLLTKVYITQACKAGENVHLALRRECFRVLLMQRIEFFDKHRASELTALLSKDLDAVRSFVFSNVSRDRGARALLEAAGSVVVLFFLSWRLGPILAAVILAAACTAFLYKQQTKKYEGSAARAQKQMTEVADETFSNIRTVRIYAGESLQRERWGEQITASCGIGLGFANAKANLEMLNRSSIHMSLLALYALGGFLVSRQLMPIRILLSAVGFTFSLVFATQGALQTFTDIRGALASIRRVQQVLKEIPVDFSMAEALPPGAWWDVATEHAAVLAATKGRERACEISYSSSEDDPDAEAEAGTAPNAAILACQSGDLVLKNVNFSYPTRPNARVLRDLNMTLPRGKITALVGYSGAGKSTIANLLERLYDVQSGEILLNGRNISTFTRAQWVSSVTAVTQEPVLFSGTIRENIGYGKAMKCTQEEIEKAARAANAHDFILSLPDAYDTFVGERGGLLSGGQRQRVALARALLKGAPILVLDEATSALDAESERLVQSAIAKLVEGRTVLVIAHRLSTVQTADQIVVLNEGKVKEMGTHSDLMKSNGLYANLVGDPQSLTLSASP